MLMLKYHLKIEMVKNIKIQNVIFKSPKVNDKNLNDMIEVDIKEQDKIMLIFMII